MPDSHDRSSPPNWIVGLAAAIGLVNLVWTVSLLGIAILFEVTCADNAVNEQQCGAGLGLGILWLIGELLLFVPTAWAIHTLLERKRNAAESFRRSR